QPLRGEQAHGQAGLDAGSDYAGGQEGPGPLLGPEIDDEGRGQVSQHGSSEQGGEYGIIDGVEKVDAGSGERQGEGGPSRQAQYQAAREIPAQGNGQDFPAPGRLRGPGKKTAQGGLEAQAGQGLEQFDENPRGGQFAHVRNAEDGGDGRQEQESGQTRQHHGGGIDEIVPARGGHADQTASSAFPSRARANPGSKASHDQRARAERQASANPE